METLFIGKNIIFLPEIHSTNSYATHMLKNVNLAEGTVVHTANQTHGKGQRGSSWIAHSKRNLTASVILKPTFLDLKKHFFLYQIVALACFDTMAEILDTSQFDIKIKWPNDILVNEKKIAGILIENNLQNNQINWCVAGIGINVNQENFGEITQATSLKLITQKDYSIELVLEKLCQHLEKHYLALRNKKFEHLKTTYLNNLYGLNKRLGFEMKGLRKNMRVLGISENGLLQLEEDSGDVIEVDVKEVKWLL
jgi:BirA family transcriptional regulator, biotin operon repressor / biotin---[acetyl-CoA-carboxylase] ligase